MAPADSGEGVSRNNRLAGANSPYLRQHQNDPVDWFPWGPEAFARARELDRPLFLSIGYSACHWCHVMGHESFADASIAEQMNELVVAVKVDREERPDVDAVYMEAVQAATGSGGWPMSVFTTPDGRPFFAGTYFPDQPRHGAPAFRQVLAAVGDVWANRRDDVEAHANALAEAVESRIGPPTPLVEPGEAGGASPSAQPTQASVVAAVLGATERLGEIADAVYGGFGRAPKFPQPLLIDLLLRAHREGLGEHGSSSALDVAVQALDAMAGGGIWDQVGGGFARYSVDRQWLVPHFEKMLYDQALLGRVYLHAWELTGEVHFLRVLDELIAYVLRDLRLEDGALASSEDADSEGEEGLFYTFTAAEFDAIVGPELAPGARAYWGVTDAGNFEGRNILFLASPEDVRARRPDGIEQARMALFAARAKRVRPGLDDKVLTEWNSMMCSTLAQAGRAAGRRDWVEAARQIADALLGRCRLASGRVLRTPVVGRGGGGARDAREAAILGYSSDLAWLVDACTRLAEATGEPSWLTEAAGVAGQLLELFVDSETGGLFTTGSDAEELLVRPRELYDNVIPSGTSVAAAALERLASLTGEASWSAAASRLVESGWQVARSSPTAVPELLWAADLVASGTVDVAVAGRREDLVQAAARDWHPRVVLAWDASGSTEHVQLLAGRREGSAYVCRFGECRLPVQTDAELVGELEAAVAPGAP